MTPEETKALYSKVFKEFNADVKALVTKYQEQYNVPVFVQLGLSAELPTQDEPTSAVRTISHDMRRYETYWLEAKK